MTRVVCVGDVMVDVRAVLPGALARGSDTPAPITVGGGGSAANTAAWLVFAGCRATLVARVGDDPAGRLAADELAAGGVDLAVSFDPELPTGTCIVLVEADGERTMIPSAGANARGGDVPDLAPGDHLHLSGYVLFHEESARRARAAVTAARVTGCDVSVDAASAQPLRGYGPAAFLGDVAPALLFANADEAAVFTGTREPESAARVLGLRCGEAIVKHAGAAVWSDGTSVVAVPCAAVEVVDSTGAGDAFAAGVLAARRGGAGTRAALEAGHALAARAIVRPGARP